MFSSKSMKAVNVVPGPDKNSSTLEFKDVEIPKLKEGEVLLKVRGTAVNRVDILQRRGEYPVPPGATEILGLEAVGTIVDANLQPISTGLVGALLSGGSYAQYVAVPESHLFPIPEGMDLTKAAAIPEIWLTAYALVEKMARLQKGENVYVNAGASAVGNALIQMCAKTYHCNVFASASTSEKVQYCRKYGAFDGIAYKEVSPQDSMEYPLKALGEKGKGYHVAFDCVGQSQEAMISKMLAMDARWIIYGFLSGPTLKESTLLASILRKRLTLKGFTLRNQDKAFKTDLVKGFTTDVLPLLANQTYDMPVDSSVEVSFSQPSDIAKIEQCHSNMLKSLNTGKMVILFKD